MFIVTVNLPEKMGTAQSSVDVEDEYPLSTAPKNTIVPKSFDFLNGLIIESNSNGCFTFRDHKPLYFISNSSSSNFREWPMRITKTAARYSETNPNPTKWFRRHRVEYLSSLSFELEDMCSVKQLHEAIQDAKTPFLLTVLPAEVLDHIGLFLPLPHTANVSLGGALSSWGGERSFFSFNFSRGDDFDAIYERTSEVAVWFENSPDEHLKSK
jgi:hypothetical protein